MSSPCLSIVIPIFLNTVGIWPRSSQLTFFTVSSLLVIAANPKARLGYWNMLVPRKRPQSMSDRLRPLDELAHRLYAQDKAFFYMDFVVEEVC